MKISAVVATYNEEKNISRCLKSLNFVDEIIIVDSRSNDNTIKIASKYTKKIFVKEFKGFSEIKQFGVNKAKFDWILIIDADEEVSEELKKKIKEIVNNKNLKIAGYYIKRETFFLGKKIKYCGWGKDFQLRLFKKSLGEFDGKIVHESIIVKGEKGFINEPIYHYSYPDSKTYFEKMNRYTTLQAIQKQKNFLLLRIIFLPFLKFFKMFFLKKGFLDGLHGFILSLYSCFSEFVKYAKMIEIKKDTLKNGLIIRMPNWIGDAVIATAFLKEAKRVFKKIYVLVDKKVKDIFEKNPYIDELIIFDKKNFLDNIKIIYKIRKYKILTGVTLTPSFSSSLLFFLAGVKRRAGFSKDGFLLNLKYKRNKKRKMHLIEEYKKIFYLVSYEFDFYNLNQEIWIDSLEEKEILKKFKFNQNKFNIIISPFAKYGPAKMWPIENFEILIKKLQERVTNAAIYIIGTKEDMIYNFKLQNKIIDLRGKTNLKEVIHLIKNSNLFIGNDSGMMHIADVFNVPSFVIFSSTSPEWTGPLSYKSFIIRSNTDCSPCFERKCRKKTYECLKVISAERVFNEIKNFLRLKN